jgi:hypothetical protein
VTITAFAYDRLYKPQRDTVELVDVPELGFLRIDGQGAPDGPEFAAAVQDLYSVSYAAHHLAKQVYGEAPRVMPLEALWWHGTGQAWAPDADRRDWSWSAMIMQPDPVDADLVAQAMAGGPNPGAPDRIALVRWAEGRCAQLLHIGPYAAEGLSIRRLHRAIAAYGLRPRGRHHEIYLGDPRRSAPAHLRTLLRQPVELA